MAGDDDLENIDEGTDTVARDDWEKKSGNLHVNLCHQIGINQELNKL